MNFYYSYKLPSKVCWSIISKLCTSTSWPYSKGCEGRVADDGPEVDGLIKVPTDDEQLTLQ